MDRSRHFISSALFWCIEELLLSILTPVCVLMVLMVCSIIIWKLCFPSSWQISSSERSSWRQNFRLRSPVLPTWVVLTLILLLNIVSPWFTKSGPIWDQFGSFYTYIWLADLKQMQECIFSSNWLFLRRRPLEYHWPSSDGPFQAPFRRAIRLNRLYIALKSYAGCSAPALQPPACCALKSRALKHLVCLECNN